MGDVEELRKMSVSNKQKISVLEINEGKIFLDSEMAEEMNNFFAEVGADNTEGKSMRYMVKA